MDRKSYKWFYDNIHSRYYDLAMKWCFLPFGGEKRCRRELIAHVDFSPGESILDMCCGTGGATFVIAEKAGETCEIIGMDLSRGQIRVAEKKNLFGHVRFIQGDVVDTGFHAAYFDKVFITHALHEMTRESRLKVLTEARRILKEKGRLIVLELDNPKNVFLRLFIGFWFLYWLPFNFETPTRRDMLKHELINEVREVGFNNVGKISKYRGVLQIVTGKR